MSDTVSTALVLGTAMWGWTLQEEDCFRIMDAYYERGGRWVDSATNYPINKQPADFRSAEQLLARWIQARGVDDLNVIMKVGSINNLYTPAHNLSPSFLLLCVQEYQQLLGDQLACLMVHWDNRDSLDEIRDSLEVLQEVPNISVGLSGIRYPEAYASVIAALGLSQLWLELKHNVMYSDYQRYQSLHAAVRCIAYGINAGGVKLSMATYSDRASLLARGGKPEKHQDVVRSLRTLMNQFTPIPGRPEPRTMNHLGLLYALLHPGIERVLLGVSSVEQLEDSFTWEAMLHKHNYQDWYSALKRIQRQ